MDGKTSGSNTAMTISSHTLVKNGQPFIKQVLEQVAPWMQTCRVTVSVKADKQTLYDLMSLKTKYPDKFIISTENVPCPSELTKERQKMLDATTEDWVLFLDDDDYWPKESLRNMMLLLSENEDVDAYASHPFQLLPDFQFDWSWRFRYFTKWFKNGPDVHFDCPWPKDNIYKGTNRLYWRKNRRVRRTKIPFFHLSMMKDHSFRGEDWASHFAFNGYTPSPLPEEWRREVCEILKYQ